MIISTSGKTPSGLIELLCAGASFDDLADNQLPALADDLDATSASFAQVIHGGDTVRLGHNFAHGRKPESHHSWQQQFRQIDPIAVAKAIPAGTGDAFPLDQWLDFPEYLRSPAYEEFWGPLGIHHVLICRLAHSDTESFLFGFHRGPRERRFSDADVARLGSLLPLLCSTLTGLRLAEEVERLRRHAADGWPLAALTRREREIATDVAEGLANKHIARRRGISVNTVENHLRSIFRKTGVNSRTKLALATGSPNSAVV
jgi:DNA-binding CsgD family transcriptional regulator